MIGALEPVAKATGYRYAAAPQRIAGCTLNMTDWPNLSYDNLLLAAEQPRLDSLGCQPEVCDLKETEAPEERRHSGIILHLQSISRVGDTGNTDHRQAHRRDCFKATAR